MAYPAGAVRLTAANDSWTPAFLHKDHLGSVRAISGPDGTPEERTLYRPYGAQTEVVTATLNDDKSWLGERYDAGAGLQYLNARYYDPELAMFYKPDWFDPTDPMVGTNRYAYGMGNPIGYRDPTGNRNDNEGDHGNVDETGGAGTGTGDSPVGGGGNASVGGSPVGGTNSGHDGDDHTGGGGGTDRMEETSPPSAGEIPPVPQAGGFFAGMRSFFTGVARCVEHCKTGYLAVRSAAKTIATNPELYNNVVEYGVRIGSENSTFVLGRATAAGLTGGAATKAASTLTSKMASRVAAETTSGETQFVAELIGMGPLAAASLGDVGYKADQYGRGLSLLEVQRIFMTGE